MSAASLRARYLSDTVSTASPQRLLVMLYDRLALDLERAQAALGSGDRQTANDTLRNAQAIVFELRESLNVDAWEGGPRLSALYSWLLGELVLANVQGNVRKVADCRTIVEPLRDAWREAAASLAMASA
ncbi:flagellar export chaperone FliS [Modestobacter sp. I12A-02628]|uniref:Flagellar export chaperone FliS n=1 Tax=Goekera deserti TaxID=2497753 RepID=A0A7K3WGK5_9ACTN|nr:flagellar export chaperone FliS [Goekera deserti]MPQ99506.1 flagellar export chaperone FliS [Goekera deserti]NDI48993.1 flagellar export chaperone FliS [Goekera deserti]NEL55537.1 flagellar export chaperone FliS [Goekera deserti]